MELFNGIDYLKINIANCKGYDKLLFSERLDWFNQTIEPYKDNIKTMDALAIKKWIEKFDEFEDYNQFYAGILAYKDYLNNRPSGHLISLDACNSGIQIMSALTACESGLEITTGYKSGKRQDAYTAIYNRFKELYGHDTERTRKECKKAVMTAFYGSVKQPKKYFGNSPKELECFYAAMELEAEGASILKNLLVDSWDNNALFHEFVLPDGFNALLPTIVDKDYEVRLGNEIIPIKLKELGTKKHGLSNAANAIHAIDALIAREMLRKAMTSRVTLGSKIEWLRKPSRGHVSNDIERLIALWEESKFTSLRILDFVGSNSRPYLPKTMKEELEDEVNSLLKQPSFTLVPIHDCFKCLPSYGNLVRYYYNHLLSKIIKSNLLEYTLHNFNVNINIPHEEYKIELASKILESNYALT